MSAPLDDYAITEAMIVFGGGFVSGLGRLWRQADSTNKGKLRDAFPEYWASYTDPVMHAALRQRVEGQS
jgi:hypothetical protein